METPKRLIERFYHEVWNRAETRLLPAKSSILNFAFAGHLGRRNEDRLVTQFRAADEQLAHTPYLTGSEITVADLGLYPIYAGRKALIVSIR